MEKGFSRNIARCATVKAMTPVRIIDLVAPLTDEVTDMRTTDTTESATSESGAVTALSIRRGDVDSANKQSTPRITPGIRTSTTVTRTTTTRTTTSGHALSAHQSEIHHADFSFEELVTAYFDCREHKRNTRTALAFESDLEHNLCRLHDDLKSGSYKLGQSICFIITHPKVREVWAADFRDRIVHHLLYNHISPRFYSRFIVDSCACIPGRGTLYAAQRLESKVRSITQNWSRPAYYLKADLANFFVSIDKLILRDLIALHVTEPWWLQLAEMMIFHDPRTNVIIQSAPELMARVPAHKSLFGQPVHLGLPIGNLSSQFFANVLLDELDQFVKHRLRAPHYIRYVDDFLLLHESPQQLNAWHREIRAFLPERLGLRLNDSKTILQPVDRGIDFVGQVIKPWRRTLRRRTLREGISRLETMPAADLFTAGNSYFGLARQATKSHHDRTRIANVLRRRGHTVNQSFTKTYRRSTTKGVLHV